MPDYSKNIVYLSQAQYQELVTNGTITVNGVTVTYNENDIYVTPQAEPVTDVRVNGTSVVSNGVANVPLMGENTIGVAKLGSSNGLYGLIISAGSLMVNPADDYAIKTGSGKRKPITSEIQNKSVFYGLAKAAGDTTQTLSPNTVGTYTDSAKAAIQHMLGTDTIIAPEENDLIASKAYAIGEPFMANGKLYKATAAIAATETIIVEGASANAEETSVDGTFVKKTDIATNSTLGIVKAHPDYGLNLYSSGLLTISAASDASIKAGANGARPISCSNQHKSVFYGLSKVAGVDLANETVTLGTYPETSKAAIRSMIGAENGDDIVKVQDTQPSTTATKIWLPETPPQSVSVPTVSEMESALSDKVGFTDYAGSTDAGVVKINLDYGTDIASGVLKIKPASSDNIKTANGSNMCNYRPVVPATQHESVFYGLAKAAGDLTQSASSNAVGTYTADAKAAIKSMIGVNVDDVQVDGTSIVSNNIATIPIASTSDLGVVKVNPIGGIGYISSTDKTISILPAGSNQIKPGTNTSRVIVPGYQHESVFYGLAKAAGDSTQSASSNAVGTYTAEAKAAIQAMLGINLATIAQEVEIPLVETVSGTTPTITGQPNTRYNCGEVSTLSITPPAAGSIDVYFTSGTTATVLTVPNTVKFPAWFDATALETDTIYEILITDATYGSVMTWAA